MDRLVLQELQKENTRSGQDRAGEKKTRAEDQRNAVLCSLKANEGYGGENKCEQGRDDLQIALQNGVRGDGEAPQPQGKRKDGGKSRNMRKENVRPLLAVMA